MTARSSPPSPVSCSPVPRAPVPDATFLKLALRPHRERVLEVLRRASFVRGEYLELVVAGVPSVTRLGVFVWPEPLGRARTVTVDVVSMDARVLKTAVSFPLELRPRERPRAVDELAPIVVSMDEVGGDGSGGGDVIRVDTPVGVAVWRHVEDGRVEREVQRLDARGVAVLADVDTSVYCYRLTCPRCGRVRYAQRNSLHQVWMCKVCTRGMRLRKKALSQYRSRHGKSR